MTRSIVTEDHDRAELHLHVGDELVIRLEAIPGTGYSWVVSGPGGGILQQVGEPRFEKADQKTMGGAEKQVLTFRVESAGKQTLELEYRRAWEKPGTAKKSFSVKAIVE